LFVFGQYRISRFYGSFFESPSGKCELRVSNSIPVEIPFRCELVNNFFIARTSRVKESGGWDADLKVGEHEDFFYRLKKTGLKIAYLPGFATSHYPVISSNYKEYRIRALEFKKLFVKKQGFSSYREVLIDTGKVLFEV
jgi:hypothetical protein